MRSGAIVGGQRPDQLFEVTGTEVAVLIEHATGVPTTYEQSR